MDRPFRQYLCVVCGYVYDEAKGDPDGGLAPGTRFEDIPEDWYCPVCGVGKTDFSLKGEPAPAPATFAGGARSGAVPMARRRSYGSEANPLVIVGAGIAGWSVAAGVRRHDRDRPICLVTACDGAVYSKPALSTCMGRELPPEALIESSGEARAAALQVDLRARSRVIALDTRRRRVLTSRGGIPYGDLVLALGAEPIELPLAGSGAGDVLRVNDLQSYRTLRARLTGGSRHVLIIGAGIVGCEFAEDLAAAGHRATVVDLSDRPLAALLPPPAALGLQERMAERGIGFRFGTSVASIERAGNGFTVHLESGESLPADAVLSAVGLRPNVALARRAGIASSRGIRVNGVLATSVPRIHALGDCAELEGTVYAYIDPIRRQAEVLAARLCGAESRFEARAPLVRVKTPSLPVAVCLPPGNAGAWVMTASAAEACRMEHRTGGVLDGFALTGPFAREAESLYRGLAPTPHRGIAATALAEAG